MSIIKKKKILLIIFLLSICLQNISIIEFDSFSLKLYHIISLFFLPYLIKREKIQFPNKFIIIFFMYIIMMSVIAYLKFGFNSLIFNYIFSLYVILIIINFGKEINKADWLKIMKTVAIIMATLVIARFIKYHKEIFTFLKQANINGHPDYIIGTYFGGGANLEATWIALLGFSFYQDRKGYLYFIISALTSVVYVSRTGIVLNMILCLWLLFQKNDGEIKELPKNSKAKIVFIILLLIALVIVLKLGMLDYILTRLLSSGGTKDKGMTGRYNMWKYIFETFVNNPIGYGLGNAVTGIELISNNIYSEGNVHNIYAQMFLDTGIIGGIYFIELIIIFLWIECKNFFRNPFVAFIITYFIGGLVQFRGGDVLFFWVVAIYLLNFIQRKQSNIVTKKLKERSDINSYG